METQTNSGTERGIVLREEFAATESRRQAETALAAVAARERAQVEAMYVMAERHPRNWDTVRVSVLGHCSRPRFAEAAKYRKPVGRKLINGEWREQFVEGLSARFAETAGQEAGNLAKGSLVTYEDDLIRIVRAFVTDVQRNVTLAAELTIAKVVERKGKKKGDGWMPPDGRDVISQRPNSYGETVFLVRATDDEMKNKQNSEISKAQRNFVLQLLPPDIKEEAMERINKVLADPQAIDPTAAKKRIVDSFASIGVMPEDLVTYLSSSLERVGPAQIEELRGLFTAIRDGDTTFQEALRVRFDPAAEGGEETPQQHDARLQRQMRSQEEVAKERIAKVAAETGQKPKVEPEPPSDAAEPTEEQMQAWQAIQDHARGPEPEPPSKPRRRGF